MLPLKKDFDENITTTHAKFRAHQKRGHNIKLELNIEQETPGRSKPNRKLWITFSPLSNDPFHNKC